MRHERFSKPPRLRTHVEREAAAWRAGSLIALVVAALATYGWYDADEFVNLDQARRANAGLDLYTETPSHHPPLYVEYVLRPLSALPGSDLLAARLANVVLVWASGVLCAQRVGRRLGPGSERLFLVLWSLNGFLLTAGTRALNEAPLLFLAVLGFTVAGSRPLAAGALGSLALLTRLTAPFAFAWALTMPRRALGRALFAAAGLLAGFLLFQDLLHPGSWRPMLDGVLGFHLQRGPQAVERRLGTWLLYGLPLVAAALLAAPGLRRPGPEAKPLWMAFGASAFLPLLPSLHPHYLLPFAPLGVAAIVVAIAQAPQRRAVLIAVAIVTPLVQGAAYIPQTPQPSLARAEEAARWIEAHAAPGWPILTDAPEYAFLSGRENWHGYFWSLKDAWGEERLRPALNETSLVVVSPRFGDYDRGYPAGFLERLAPLPCVEVAHTRLYWTGATGAAPPEMARC